MITREEARQMALFDIEKEISKRGEDAVIVRCPMPGKNSWTAKEYKEAILEDKCLENTKSNPIDDYFALEKRYNERGKSLKDEERYDTLFREATKEKYNMTFDEAQEFESKRGYDVLWNDGDINIDERSMTETVANVVAWADDSLMSNLHDFLRTYDISGLTPEEIVSEFKKFTGYWD